MVDISKYAFTVQAYDAATATSRNLDVKSMTVSLDIDRSPYVSIRLVIAPPDATTFTWLDPRGVRRVRWRVTQTFINFETESGATAAVLPGTGWGMACIRRRVRKLISGEVVLDLSSFDALLDDKRRIAGSTLTTTATNLKALVEASVLNLADSYIDINTTVLDNVGAASVAIPAGDRRVMNPGETLSELFEAELTAANARLITDTNGQQFKIDSNGRSIGAGLLLLLYTGDYTGPLDGSENARIIGDPDEVTDRADWADGVLVKYSYTNGSGVLTTAYQPSGSGVNTRGIVVTQQRPAPSANAANQIVARRKTRGVSYRIIAEAALFVFPLMTCAIRIGNAAAVTGKVAAVSWDFPGGTMTVDVNVE